LSVSSFDQAGESLAVVLWTSKAIRLIKSLLSPAERTRSVQIDLDPLNDQWGLFESPHVFGVGGNKRLTEEKKYLDRVIMTRRQRKRREKYMDRVDYYTTAVSQ